MSASRRKGTAFETAVVGFLTEHGHPFAERRAQHGNSDRGDVAGIAGWVIECKAEKSIELARYMDETAVERVNAGSSYGAAVVKRRGKSVGDSYVVMSLATFATLLAEENPS